MTRALALLLLAAGCAPTIDARTSAVDAPVVLAVVPEPPEAAPGDEVGFTVIAAGPDGPIATAAAGWAWCTAPRPAVEPGSVSTACLGDDDALAPVGEGGAIVATLPIDACARFGPDTPPGGFRPRDPDPTGGYYQPIVVTVDDVAGPAIGFARLGCNLDDAPFEVARAYRERYVANANPPLALWRWQDGARIAPTRAARGEVVALEAAWPRAAAEPYVALDLATLALVERREAMAIAWFATGGSFTADATGRAEGDPATASGNAWTAPEVAGPIDLWAVLRDSRGGVAVAHATVDVE
jgi:hypothetical protein